MRSRTWILRVTGAALLAALVGLTTPALAAHGISVGEVSYDLSAMMARKDAVVKTLTGGVEFLFKKNKIDRFLGAARLLDPQTVEVNGKTSLHLQTRAILIATGSTAATIPGGVIDGNRIVSSTEALAFTEVPKSLVVAGAGAVGLELGSVWQRLGTQVRAVSQGNPFVVTETLRALPERFTTEPLSLAMPDRVRSGIRRQRREAGLAEQAVPERVLGLRVPTELADHVRSEQGRQVALEPVALGDPGEHAERKATADDGRDLREAAAARREQVDPREEQALERRREKLRLAHRGRPRLADVDLPEENGKEAARNGDLQRDLERARHGYRVKAACTRWSASAASSMSCFECAGERGSERTSAPALSATGSGGCSGNRSR